MRITRPHPLRVATLVAVGMCTLWLLTACGGGGASNPVNPPASMTPTAAFVAPATAAANAAVAFDANASVSADGSALQYVWDFGDGQRGSGATIAHLFTSAGARSVTLTVVDGAGRSATLVRSVTVAAPPAAAGTITVEGAIETLAGVALESVDVSLVGGVATGTTDATGKVHLSLGSGVPLTLKLAKLGYADQFVSLNVPANAGADAYFKAAMRTRDAALTLADAAAGGSLTGRDGALLTLPPNALVNASGGAVMGAVQVSVTPVDVTQPAAAGFPGRFDGVKPDGVVTPIVSFGVVEYKLGAAGQVLQLAPGKTAMIEVPLYATRSLDGSLVAAGATLPLWSLDEATGVWVQEGQGTIVASTGSPSGLAMRATVGHFSWWNADLGFDPYGPQPRCVYDTDSGVPGGNDTFATATICNLLAEFDRGAEASGAAGRRRAAAAQLSPRVAGYSRRQVLPIAGGVTVPVPAGVNIALNASALNGSWTGHSIVNGAVGVQQEELIKMRPIATTGPGAELITPPFDATRSLSSGQVALFSFSGATSRYARVTVSQGTASNLTGRVRLLRGSSALGTADFTGSPGQVVALLPANDTYNVEVTALTNAPGAYRLQVELLGGVQNETITLPFDVNPSIPSFTLYHGNFTIAAPLTAWFAYRANAGAATTLRVLAPDGSALVSTPTGTGSVQSTVVALPAAGTYTLEIAPEGGQAGSAHVTGAATSWQQVAPALEGSTSNNTLIDLLADRNNKPVLGYTRAVVTGAVTSAMLQLRRWTGTAWENVGSDLAIDKPCNQGVGTVSFAFDSNNDPVVAYGITTAGDGSAVAAKRYTNGGWQALGADDGVLPVTSMFGGACANAPRLAPGPNGTLAIVYRADNNVVLQRLVGAAWVAITNPAADTFFALNNDFDLAFDATGRLHFVLTAGFPSGAPSVARRLSTAPTPAWETLGPNGGALPQTNTNGLSTPRLRFDANGNLVIGVNAAIGSGVVSTGTAVYRYDGTSWSSTGGFQPDASYTGSDNSMGFAVVGSEAFMAWPNARNSQLSPVVQKNTAAGWTPIGAGLGEIPQYTVAGINVTRAYTLRLLAIGNELYLALVVVSGEGFATPTFSVTLLHKVAN